MDLNTSHGLPNCTPYGAALQNNQCFVDTRLVAKPRTQLLTQEIFNKRLRQQIQSISADALHKILSALEYEKTHGGTQHVQAEQQIRNLLIPGGYNNMSLEQLHQILINEIAKVSQDIRNLQITVNDFSRTGGNTPDTQNKVNEAMEQLGKAQEIENILKLAQQAVNNILFFKQEAEKQATATGYGRNAFVQGGGAVTRYGKRTQAHAGVSPPPQSQIYRVPPSM